eukprot:TRINITY_DN18008_c0_g1_i1.p1 TRINITY_DN18008_c0_g1~~TRINITY_DN18008_c0_g1_i1.p1  ORF type:complete len:125 (-),score=10.08 TRINITY_DN18008_c0_g1_i1:270-644(-)
MRPNISKEFKFGDNVRLISNFSKEGIVKFVGKIEGMGEYVGIELNNPFGNTDGSFYGKRYFICENNHGIFAPISEVEINMHMYIKIHQPTNTKLKRWIVSSRLIQIYMTKMIIHRILKRNQNQN